MKVDWVPLAEVLTPRDPEEVRPSGTYPLAGVYGFGRGVLLRATISGSDTGYKSLTKLSTGDVVYSKLKAFEGAIACVHRDADGRYVSPEFPVFRVHPGTSWRYLEHFIQSPTFHKSLANLSRGVGARRERVHPSRFLDLKVPLPPSSDQERIAAHLTALARRLRNAVTPDTSLPEHLPYLLGAVLKSATRSIAVVRDLAINQQVVVHPGDDLRGASEFVGLEHLEPHTGRRIGGRPIGNEAGRKLLFTPGQVTYGYLRPYLNKAWAADRLGLCSVEQFTLTPKPGVDAQVLSAVLRSEFVWRAAQEATNSLQLPRLSLGALMSFGVPDVRGLTWDSIRPEVERVTEMIVREATLRSRRQHLHDSILPAARNAVFNSMR